MNSPVTWRISLFIALAGLVLAGCGESGPQAVHLHGQVTYHGEPVPAGSIVFQSESDQPGERLRSIAAINDGAYDTRGEGGTGVLPGPVHVFVEGYDGKAKQTLPDEPSLGSPLFRPYQTAATIDGDTDTLNIEVE
jgi:hypothetical protein